MKKLWPELLVLVLFLLGDIIWDGMASAVAGAAAGLLAFLILLALKKKNSGLILEGLVFGGITALGELFEYPGGTLILMELVFAVILLLSVLSGKNIISRMTGGLGKGLFSESQSRILSLVLGFVFLGHSLFSTILSLSGHFSWWLGGTIFFVMYFLALRVSKAAMRNAVQSSLPMILEEKEGVYRLEVDRMVTGRIRLTHETSTTAVAEIVSIESKPHEFLKQLESVMKRRGLRSFTVESWIWDELELEMQGFIAVDGNWRKRL